MYELELVGSWPKVPGPFAASLAWSLPEISVCGNPDMNRFKHENFDTDRNADLIFSGLMLELGFPRYRFDGDYKLENDPT